MLTCSKLVKMQLTAIYTHKNYGLYKLATWIQYIIITVNLAPVIAYSFHAMSENSNNIRSFSYAGWLVATCTSWDSASPWRHCDPA